MLAWILRGLAQGRATTAYPARAEQPPAGFHGPVELRDPDAGPAPAELALICPTGAIAVSAAGAVELEHRRCIRCGECVRAAPERFAFARRHELAIGGPSRSLADQAGSLERSIHIRHVDTGSDGSEEWEIQALWNPYYDIQRLGFFLTSSPRHADILLVTGPVTGPMRGPLERTRELMPEPKAVVAAGTDACSGGLAGAGGLTAGGVDRVLPVDVYVPGSPPSPIALLDGLLLAAGMPRFEGRPR